METEFEVSKGHKLLGLLGSTVHSLLKARKKELEGSGVSVAQSWVLWGLKVMGEPSTVAEMSQFVDRDHQTTSQLLRRMEKDGLIVRRRTPQRNSPVRIVTTEKGKEALHDAYERHSLLDEIASSLSADELQNLSSYLQKLNAKAISKVAVHSAPHSIRTYDPGI